MPTQYRDISEQQARLRLRRTIDFGRGQQAERDRELARIDLRLVNRELAPFGYSIEVTSYARNRYVPLKASFALEGPLLERVQATLKPLAGTGNIGWCARLILIDLGLPVLKHRKAFFETDFAKVRREYRRRMDAANLLGEAK